MVELGSSLRCYTDAGGLTFLLAGQDTAGKMGFDAPALRIPIQAIVLVTPEENWLLSTTMRAEMLGHQFICNNERVSTMIEDFQRHREYQWSVLIYFPQGA